MADVTGSIGNEFVELNNAATEATLRALLDAVRSSSKGNIAELRKLAEKSGVPTAQTIQPEVIQKASSSLQGLGVSVGKFASSLVSSGLQVGKGLADFSGKLVEGTAQTSDLLTAFTKLPGPIGKVAEGLRMIQVYQEQNMKMYQQITTAGVSFSGSLTELRSAMAGMRMTQEEFTSFMKANSESLAFFGKNTNDGAKNFAALSNALQEGEVGQRLKSLGYTSEQLNQGMATYLAATGGRTKKEMENTTQLAGAASRYFEQLDALAAITGKSREEQEAQMKQAAQNAAFQNHLATLDEKSREKAMAAYQNALARGGKGAADAVMSGLMGLPLLSKESRQFAAVNREAYEATQKIVADVQDSSKSLDDVKKGGDELAYSLGEFARNNPKLAQALALQGGTLGEAMQKTLLEANRAKQQDVNSTKDAIAQREKIEADQKKRSDTEAGRQASLAQALEELRKTIIDKVINPIVQIVEPALSGIMLSFNTWLKPQIEKLGKFIENDIVPIFKRIWTFIDQNILPVFGRLWDYIDKNILPIFGQIWDKISGFVKPAFDMIDSVLRNIVIPVLEEIGNFILFGFKWALIGVREALDFFQAPFKSFSDKIQSASEGFAKLNESLGGALTKGIGGLVTALIGWKYIGKPIYDRIRGIPGGGAGGAGGGSPLPDTGDRAGILTRRGHSRDKPLYVEVVPGLFGGSRGRGFRRSRRPTGGGRPPTTTPSTPTPATGSGARPPAPTPTTSPTAGGAAASGAARVGAGASTLGGTAAAGATAAGAGGAAAGAGGAAAGAGGAAAGAGKLSVPKRLMNFLKAAKSIPGMAAIVGGLDFLNIAMYSDTEDLFGDLSKSIAGTAGGIGGAKLGAFLGTLAFPGLGTIGGGVLGWMLGQYGGEWIAEKIINWFRGDKEKVDIPKATSGSPEQNMPSMDQTLTPMANGGIVTGPTKALIGEAGQPEAVLPLDKLSEILSDFVPKASSAVPEGSPKPGDVSTTSNKSMENLYSELQRLNNISFETLKYIKEVAEYSRRNVDVTRSLSGDLFSM